jgi:polyisoprenoid-binding protein YceI
LESAKYPETVFRPDRADAKLKAQGTSTVQVHGIFNIHGTDHEITIPVQVEMAQNRWTASAHFEIPYVKWGIKNPSNFFLHVSQTVAIDIRASGPNP